MRAIVVLFPVFAIALGNTTVQSTVGLFGRSTGLSEFQVGLFFASSAVLFFLTSSVWGGLADRWGRRPVILTGLAGGGASFVLVAAIYAFGPGSMSASLIFVTLLFARVIYGLLSGGVQPAAIAHIADTAVERQHSTAAALVGAALGLASIVGPLFAAVLIGFGFATPIGGACTLMLIAGFMARAIPTRTRATGSKAVLFALPGRAVMPYLVLTFAIVLGLSALQPTMAFFVQDRLAIGTTLAIQYASFVSAAFATCSFVVQALVVPALTMSPHRLLMIGVAACCCGLGLCLAATDLPALVIGFGALGAGFGFMQPGLLAGAMLATGTARQGQVAGHMQSVMSAAWVVGPLVGTAAYSLSIEGPLLLAAVALVAGTLGYSVLMATVSRSGGSNTARPAGWSTAPPASPSSAATAPVPACSRWS
jgi:MFS family permease